MTFSLSFKLSLLRLYLCCLK